MDAGFLEIVIRLANLIGKIIFNLQPMNLHNKYKEKFIEFY
jgi:hypothetical protein